MNRAQTLIAKTLGSVPPAATGEVALNGHTNGALTKSTSAKPPVSPQRGGPVPLHSYTCDDRGNGQRFTAVWGADVAWVPDEKKTHIWTGTRWEVDTGARMRNLAHEMTDLMLTESAERLVVAQRQFDAAAKDTPEKKKAGAALAKAKEYALWTKSPAWTSNYGHASPAPSPTQARRSNLASGMPPQRCSTSRTALCVSTTQSRSNNITERTDSPSKAAPSTFPEPSTPSSMSS